VGVGAVAGSVDDASAGDFEAAWGWACNSAEAERMVATMNRIGVLRRILGVGRVAAMEVIGAVSC